MNIKNYLKQPPSISYTWANSGSYLSSLDFVAKYGGISALYAFFSKQVIATSLTCGHVNWFCLFRLNNPSWEVVKLDHFPEVWGKKKNIFQTTTKRRAVWGVDSLTITTNWRLGRCGGSRPLRFSWYQLPKPNFVCPAKARLTRRTDSHPHPVFLGSQKNSGKLQKGL